MTDWRDDPIVVEKLGLLGWALVALRGLTLGAVTYGGLLLLLLLRLIERALFAQQRPITPFITFPSNTAKMTLSTLPLFIYLLIVHFTIYINVFAIFLQFKYTPSTSNSCSFNPAANFSIGIYQNLRHPVGIRTSHPTRHT